MSKDRLFSHLGLGLFALGLLLLLSIYTPVLFQEARFTLSTLQDQTYTVLGPQEATSSSQQQPELAFKPTVIKPVNFDFSVVIPKLGINSPVFANIDSGDPAVYLPVLRQGVAHALNSSLPDQSGPVFLFAHSTDSFYNISSYNAVFFLLNKLKTDDEIHIFYQNRRYLYHVTNQEVLAPEAISGVVSQIKQPTLVLQTCYPPGTTLKRLLVYAVPSN